MRARLFAILTGVGVMVLSLGLIAWADPEKKGDVDIKQFKDDAALAEQHMSRQFNDLMQGVLKLRDRLKRSDKQADRDQAAMLDKVLESAKDRGISTQFERVVDFLNKQNFKNLDDYKELSDKSKKLADDLRILVELLRMDAQADRSREQAKKLAEIIKEIERAIITQQIVQKQTENARTEKKELHANQKGATDQTAKIAKAIDGLSNPNGAAAKDLKGDQKDGGKPGGQKADAKDQGPDTGAKKSETKPGDGAKDQKPGDAKGSESKSGQGSDSKPSQAKDGKGADSKSQSGAKDAKDSKGGQGQAKDSKSGQGGKDGGNPKDQGKKDDKDNKPATAKDDGNKSSLKKKEDPAQAKDQGKKGDKEAGAKDSKSGDQKQTGGQKDSGQQKQADAKEGSQSKGQAQAKSDGKPSKGSPSQGSPSEGQPSAKSGDPKSDQSPNQKPQPPDDNQIAKKKVQDANYEQQQAESNIKKEDNKEAANNQQKAVDDLNAAKKKLEELLRQIREEELERLLAALRVRCERMLAMQIAVYNGTVGVQTSIDGNADKKASRENQNESLKLSDQEKEIVAEATKAIEMLEAEGSAVAFPEVFQQVREDMKHVQRRLDVTDTGKVTQAIEQDIIDTLKEMIDALKKAEKELQDKKSPPPGPAGKKGPPQDQKLLDQIAELKMIRSMQLRVNARTQTYGKMYQGEQANDPAIRKEVIQLGDRQEKIYEVTNKIAKGDNK